MGNNTLFLFQTFRKSLIKNASRKKKTKPLQGLWVNPSWACGGTGRARDGAESHSAKRETGLRKEVEKENERIL